MAGEEREHGGPGRRSRWRAMVGFLRWLAARETLPSLAAPAAPRRLAGSVAAPLSSADRLSAAAPARPGFLAWLLASEQLPTAPTPAPSRPGLLATLIARERLPAAPELPSPSPPAAPHPAAPDKE